jgi:excisionase family DNA binding protein
VGEPILKLDGIFKIPGSTAPILRGQNDTAMDILIEGGKNLGSTTETRKLLKCSRETIIHLLKTGQIDGFKFGRNWRVRLDSVNRYIEYQACTANKKSSSEILTGK